MGGLDSGKKHIFQLYHNGTAILVWFGDDVSYELFKVGTGDPDQYDVRIVLQNGIQCAYWKRADEEHYNLGPSATIASFASGIGLSICGRGKAAAGSLFMILRPLPNFSGLVSHAIPSRSDSVLSLSLRRMPFNCRPRDWRSF